MCVLKCLGNIQQLNNTFSRVCIYIANGRHCQADCSATWTRQKTSLDWQNSVNWTSWSTSCKKTWNKFSALVIILPCVCFVFTPMFVLVLLWNVFPCVAPELWWCCHFLFVYCYWYCMYGLIVVFIEAIFMIIDVSTNYCPGSLENLIWLLLE